ncbi:MAG: DsbA family protein [Sulfurovum sp.]|nr:MAG: DsbA family protein [Sulfurovum sp.]
MTFDKSYILSRPVSSSDHAQGSTNAKVTLVEYGDYQCPYCAQAFYVVKKLQEDFGDNLQFVFRNFPLTQIHRYAFKAAQATEIADDYGKFWQMHDTIYNNQNLLNDEELLVFAENIGIDAQAFTAKLNNNEKQQRVQDDFDSGVKSGVQGTPTFFINNEKYGGPTDYESLKILLEKHLNQ